MTKLLGILAILFFACPVSPKGKVYDPLAARFKQEELNNNNYYENQ